MGWGVVAGDPQPRTQTLLPGPRPHSPSLPWPWPIPTPRYLKFSSQHGPHDPIMSGCLPSNPWIADSDTYWVVNAPR